MHIVIADQLPASAVGLLASLAGWTVDAKAGRAPADLARDLANADALVVRSATTVDEALMAAAPKLRVIARAGTGVDNVDVPAATARGIVVMNAPGANSVSVAEHALALMLSLARAVPAADATMKRGVWDKKKLTGIELRGKTLGLVGLGRIGQEVAARARAFGMEIVAHDPFISEQVAGTLGVELLDLDGLCARADYISLHIPATPETRHLFNSRASGEVPQADARIINTARGELIDEAALAEAITSRHIAGAGLDVFETEPPRDSVLTALPQVVATPHIAASTVEAQEQVGLETAAAVRDFLLDGVIRNAVNFPAVPSEEFEQGPAVHGPRRADGRAGLAARRRTHALDRHPLLRTARRAPMPACSPARWSPACSGRCCRRPSPSSTRARSRRAAASRSSSRRARGRATSRTCCRSSCTRARANGGSKARSSSRAARGCRCSTGSTSRRRSRAVVLVLHNDDQPGVIGGVGTILGPTRHQHRQLRARAERDGAVGVVALDSDADAPALLAAVQEIRALPAVKDARTATITPRR